VTISDVVTAAVGGCASTAPGAIALFGLVAIGLLRRRRA
jgi:MYXO-CTERM domain-containing protein